MNVDLRKHNTRAVNPGEKFKATITILKQADPNLLILPLTLSSLDTILHRIATVPTASPELENYYEYKIKNFQVESMFRIRTEFTIFQLKNRPGVMNQLTQMGVYLRHTQLKTIKTKIIGTLYKSHSFYTRREDAQLELKKRIQDTSGNDCPPFILTPGLHTHSPPTHYTGESPVIKQDTILVECEIRHADQVL